MTTDITNTVTKSLDHFTAIKILYTSTKYPVIVITLANIVTKYS